MSAIVTWEIEIITTEANYINPGTTKSTKII